MNLTLFWIESNKLTYTLVKGTEDICPSTRELELDYLATRFE